MASSLQEPNLRLDHRLSARIDSLLRDLLDRNDSSCGPMLCSINGAEDTFAEATALSKGSRVS